ncbi:restriction endonuclease [Streptosporangium sandarakinum]|uniref:restriction endonuclease n=1 Tax=Streptosporangium sandarakinum TaxID=1260955 RepID=UPI003428AB8C
MPSRRPARGRRTGTSRTGRRKGRRGGRLEWTDLFLWGVAAVLAYAALRSALPFARSHLPWFVASAVAVLAAAAAVPIVRARTVAARQRRWFEANLELERVDRLTGPEFETLTAGLLRRDGFRQVRELGGSGDRGVDLTAVGPDGRRYAFQCKRYAGSVGAPEVRNFLGALAHAFAGHTGVLVTSGRLTRQALAEAGEAGLILVERDLLAGWLRGEPLPREPLRSG